MKLLVATAAVLVTATALSAQTKIPGKVIDPEGKPVSGIEVLLHGVGEKSGSQIDKDTTKSDGSFQVNVNTPDPNLVYFVAVVWNGQLFVGDMMRPPFPSNQEYIVQVGVNPVDLGQSQQNAAPPPSPQEQQKDRSNGIIVVIVAVVVISLAGFLLWRRRPPAHRRVLVQLARLEDEIESHPDDARLQKRRAELRTRLRSAKTT